MVASLILMPDLALYPHEQEDLHLLGELEKIYKGDSKMWPPKYQGMLSHKQISFIMIVMWSEGSFQSL